MAPSLAALCQYTILDNIDAFGPILLPETLADKMAKLSLKSGLQKADVKLFHGVQTIRAKHPLAPETIQELFDRHRDTLQVVELTHCDFKDVKFGQTRLKQLKSLALISARNLTQSQFNDLCSILPQEIDSLSIKECPNITPNCPLLPKINTLVFVPAEIFNSALELSIDD